MADDFKARVNKEHEQLADNMLKLNKFMKTEAFEALPLAERQRLARQYSAMGVYKDALGERIAADFQ